MRPPLNAEFAIQCTIQCAILGNLLLGFGPCWTSVSHANNKQAGTRAQAQVSFC